MGVALRAWRGDLLEALGGDAIVSPQRRALVEVATRTHLMLESVDRYILAMPCLVNKSKRQLFAVVRERQTLADGLARTLGQLGLERRAREARSYAERLLATQDAEEVAPAPQVDAAVPEPAEVKADAAVGGSDDD